MRLEGEETKLEVLLFKDELVTDEIGQQPEYRVASTAYGITKGLLRHPIPEGRIKKVDEPDDIFGNSLHFMCV